MSIVSIDPELFFTVQTETSRCLYQTVIAYRDEARTVPTVSNIATWQNKQTAEKIDGSFGGSNHILFNIGPTTSALSPVYLTFLTEGTDSNGNKL